MKPEFWHERWKQNQIAFHKTEINPFLKDFWHKTKLSQDTTVLVPMCGKSLDLIWLNDQGHRVVGVELSEIAAEEFCRENNLHGSRRPIPAGVVYQLGPKLSFICGDFFNVAPEDTGKIQAVYDRASLIALPPDMRKKYARHMTSMLDPGAKIFMITFEYDQSKMVGPPFSVSPEEIRALYKDHFEIREIHHQENSGGLPRLGNEKSLERVYILTKN